MPLPVQRRRKQRVGIRIDDQRFARRIDDLCELGLKWLLRIVGPRLEFAVLEWPQRAFQRKLCIVRERRWQRETRLADVHRSLAEPVG
jgi:hypothetical protein